MKRKIGQPPAGMYRMTQAEVARALRTSRQRVAEIEKRALEKLRKHLQQGAK